MRGNIASSVWADAAYRSEAMEAKLRDQNLTSHIHRKGKRGKPLTKQAKESIRTKFTVKVRVERGMGVTNGISLRHLPVLGFVLRRTISKLSQ
jgi:IS5 family transposase